MQLIPSLLFGISVSLDALVVGIGYGIRRVKIRPWQNLLISLISLIGTCLSVGIGRVLFHHSSSFPGVVLGSGILILYGIYYISKYLFYPHASPSEDSHKVTAANYLSNAEVFSLSVALAANNIGIGLSASIAGLPFCLAAFMTFLFSVLFLFLGNRLGSCRLFYLAAKRADLIAGCLLIGLGLWEVCLNLI